VSGAPNAPYGTSNYFCPGCYYLHETVNATTFSVGWSYGNISFSAQTGYTNTASMYFHWNLTTTPGGYLHGTVGEPPNSGVDVGTLGPCCTG